LFVIMRQEFGLVRGHVGMGGAVAAATVARQTGIQRFFDLFTVPAVLYNVALQHFPKQARAPTRGKAFVLGGAIARAHGAALLAAATAHAYAAFDGTLKTIAFHTLEV